MWSYSLSHHVGKKTNLGAKYVRNFLWAWAWGIKTKGAFLWVAEAITEVTLCLNLAHQTINTALKRKLDPVFAHWAFLQRVNSHFYGHSFSLGLMRLTQTASASVAHCMLGAVIVCSATTSGRIDPGRINMPLDDFKCGCFFTLMGQQRNVSSPSLTAAERLNCTIKGFHREIMKAVRWYQFPALWLRLDQNGLYVSDEVVCFCFSLYVKTQVRCYTAWHDGFLWCYRCNPTAEY